MATLFHKLFGMAGARRARWVIAAISLLTWSCQLIKYDRVENTLSFTRIVDSLKAYDTVVIVLKHIDGSLLDTLLHGKVTQAADVRNLPAPHWDGSPVRVAITGKQGGKVVYQAESRFDPATGKIDDPVVRLTPDTRLSTPDKKLTFLVGDSRALPGVEVHPPNLFDKTLVWSAEPAHLVQLEPGSVKALQAGSGQIVVSLKADPGIKVIIPITVAATGVAPQKVSIEPESLEVVAQGPTGSFKVKVDPVDAIAGVTWTSADTNVAQVDTNGIVQGRRAGETSVLAASSVRPDIRDFAKVKVSAPPTAGPPAPEIAGTSPTRALPHWSWKSGGAGGVGVFRHRLGDANFPVGATGSTDTSYTLASAVSGTTYVLFVQERDAGGNWSPASSHPVKYDLTRPSIAISSPKASGTYITALDTVTLAGSVTGPNGIAKLEYSVDSGAATALVVGSGGAWTLAALRLTNAKKTAIRLKASDSLGNSGEAGLEIHRDSDPPSPPVFQTTPASPTAVATGSWTWGPGNDGTAGSGLSGNYRWKLNEGDWNLVATPAATGISLAEGINNFSVQEEDEAGLWSASAMRTVVVDTKPPDAVTFTGTDNSVSPTRTPTWSWTSGTNGGTGTYVLSLDGGAEFDWTTKSFTPTTPLTDNAKHTLTVKERDQVQGVMGAPRSFSYMVRTGLDPSKPWGGLKNPPVRSSGCGKAMGWTSTQRTVLVNDTSRAYLIDIPTDYDVNHPYRLIFVFHALGGTPEEVKAQGFDYLQPLANSAGQPAVFIAPQAVGGRWDQRDHALFDALLVQAMANLCIDSTRVFASGMSFGGAFTYSLSTTRQKRIRAAIGLSPFNYNIWLPNPLPTDPIAWMQTTGMSDATAPWVSNETMQRGSKFTAMKHAQDNGCGLPAEIPTWISGSHVCYDFVACKEEFPTRACTFNGGHTSSNMDPGSSVNWIPVESWKFISQF